MGVWREEYLSIAAAARVVGVSRRTVYNWLEAGKLAFVRLPSGMRRIRRADLVRPAEGRSDTGAASC